MERTNHEVIRIGVVSTLSGITRYTIKKQLRSCLYPDWKQRGGNYAYKTDIIHVLEIIGVQRNIDFTGSASRECGIAISFFHRLVLNDFEV